MGDSRQEGSPLTGMILPPPGVVEAVGMAPEGAQLIASGLSTKVKSSLNEETECPEVETLHFMVRRQPAQPS